MGSPEIQVHSVREPTVADLVSAAIVGDSAAWNAIVDRFAELVWAIARRHRLSAADAADVSQTTWLRLVEHLERIEKPERIGAWLATTARHESLRVLRLAKRQIPAPNEDFIDLTRDDERGADAALLTADRDRELTELVMSLPPRCRELLVVLMNESSPNYVEIGREVGMPTGSIGPTRARCLERIRRLAASRGICLDRDDS
jgi:RNA polymerase sigma factor (sigma-70 family)